MINLIKRKKNNNIPFVWVIILLVVIFFVVRNYYNIYDLRKNGIHIKGFLYEVKGVGSKGIIRGFYRFEINNNYYEGFFSFVNKKQKLNTKS